MKELKAPPKTLPRSVGHYKEWVEAAKGAKTEPGSNSGYSCPMTEAILLGNVAVHFPDRELRWDAEKLAFTNCPAASGLLRFELRKGWEL